MSLDNILYSFYVTSNHTRRRIIPRRSQNESSYAGLDIVLPTTFQVECLTSRVINDVPDDNYVVKTVTLIKRNAYYEAVGDDPSTFGNEFLYGKRNDIRAGGLLKNKVKTYGQELLKAVVGT
jgi:hypothetical protein